MCNKGPRQFRMQDWTKVGHECCGRGTEKWVIEHRLRSERVADAGGTTRVCAGGGLDAREQMNSATTGCIAIWIISFSIWCVHAYMLCRAMTIKRWIMCHLFGVVAMWPPNKCDCGCEYWMHLGRSCTKGACGSCVHRLLGGRGGRRYRGGAPTCGCFPKYMFAIAFVRVSHTPQFWCLRS